MDDLLDLLAQTPSFITFVDLAGLVTWTNAVTYGLPGDVMGWPSDRWVHPEDRASWQDTLRRVLFNRETLRFDVRLVVPVPPGVVHLTGRASPCVRGSEVIGGWFITHDKASDPKPAAPNPCGRFLLGDAGRKVVRLLAGRGVPLKGSAIGKALGDVSSNGQASSTLRWLLGNLVERGILTHAPAQGYAVHRDFLPHVNDALSG